MNKTAIVGLLVVAFGGVPSPARGQGWYLGSELGAHVVPALGITGLSNDRASVCDEFINPQYATVTQTAGYEAYNCTEPDRRDDWVNQFVLATGLQTSWVLGYRFGADASGPRWRHLRTEVEYFYRTTAYDQTVAVPGLIPGIRRAALQPRLTRGQELVTPLRGPRRRDPQFPRHRLEILAPQQAEYRRAFTPGRKPPPPVTLGGRSSRPPGALRRRRFLTLLPHLDTPSARTLSQSSVQETC